MNDVNEFLLLLLSVCMFLRTPVNLDLQKMEKELEKLEEVWGLVGQWEDSWDKYKALTFWELETDEMEENVMFLFRYTFVFLDYKVMSLVLKPTILYNVSLQVQLKT